MTNNYQVDELYSRLDKQYILLDKDLIHCARNINLIPSIENRSGGKASYAEWAYIIGIFQTLIYLHSDQKENISVLDVGCGSGLLGIACQPFLGRTGRYVGLDVNQAEIAFCREHYPAPTFEFVHFEAHHSIYAPFQKAVRPPWSFTSQSFDLLLSLSLWTHLNEQDAIFYIKEVSRVLKPGAKAILTFYILDETYTHHIAKHSGGLSHFHNTDFDRWVFDRPAYGSQAWFCPKWATIPESAIAITRDGLDHLVMNASLECLVHYVGSWKEVPGIFFQDVLVLSKIADL